MSIARTAKHTLRDALKRSGFRIHRIPRALNSSPGAALQFSYEILAPFALQGLDSVYFVQVGANDGSREDPIQSFIWSQGWQGALIEPQPEVFEALKKNYARSVGLTFINAALNHKPGRSTLYYIEPHPNLPDFAIGMASFDKGVILSHQRWIPNLKSHIKEVDVECVTFDMALERAKLPRVDVLQIDVEGFDAEIIKMFDFGRYRPRIVCYEWKHLTRTAYDAAARRLVDFGYQLAPAGADMFAVRPQVKEAFGYIGPSVPKTPS